MLEEKVLYNVLKAIKNKKSLDVAPDREYLDCLEKIGMVHISWDNHLTKFGESILNHLTNKLKKW